QHRVDLGLRRRREQYGLRDRQGGTGRFDERAGARARPRRARERNRARTGALELGVLVRRPGRARAGEHTAGARRRARGLCAGHCVPVHRGRLHHRRGDFRERRRAAVAVARVLALGILARLLFGGELYAAGALTVQANHETLLGARGERFAQVASFKGIPFAAAPVGELRWQAPRPHAPRAGTQHATEFAAACFQDSYNTDWYRDLAQNFGVDAAAFADPTVSEDCLYLNVWTPALGARARLPVMVWIHGGANKSGWSFEPNYLGEALAARGDVVVVTIAYRLGIFGFFGHPQLRGSAAPSNFGLLDQIAALHWVKDNIRAFGGDAGNVTVFGESAGGADIGYLAASPLARGLMRRALV